MLLQVSLQLEKGNSAADVAVSVHAGQDLESESKNHEQRCHIKNLLPTILQGVCPSKLHRHACCVRVRWSVRLEQVFLCMVSVVEPAHVDESLGAEPNWKPHTVTESKQCHNTPCNLKCQEAADQIHRGSNACATALTSLTVPTVAIPISSL
jgi:hypothetical protein